MTTAYSAIITSTHGPHSQHLEESTMNSDSPVAESFKMSDNKNGCPADTMNDSSARESSCPPAGYQPTPLYKNSSPTSAVMTPKFPNSYCPPSLRAKILSHTQPYPTFLKAHLEPDTRSRSVPPVRIRLRTSDMSPTRSTKSDAAASFPGLKQLGWTPHHILGDGNCLFRALSHQLYGHDQLHSHVRSEVIAQFRQDRDLLLPFMAEDLRRSTRTTRGRQPAAAPSGPSATQAEIFEQRIAMMEKSRTWGDHLEIQTFCNLKQCNVVIFSEGGAMPIVHPRGITDPSHLDTYYLAYHQHEHYSSVRHRIQYVSLPKTLAAFDTERGVGPPANTPALTVDNGSDDSTSTPVESESENTYAVPNMRKRNLQQFRSFEGARSKAARPFDEGCKLKRIKLRVKEPQSEPTTLGSRMRPVEVD